MNNIEVKRIGKQEMKVLDGSPMIAIYERPEDFPEKFVARLFDMHDKKHKPTEIIAIADTLEDIRRKIPCWKMSSIKNLSTDDARIVEVWI